MISFINNKLSQIMGNDQKKATTPRTASQYHPDIVIVSENKANNQTADNSSDVNKLDYVPLFYPILKNSINVREESQLFQINSDSMIQLTEALKTHLNSCAYNVTNDQNVITKEINRVNFVLETLLENMIEKQRKYAKYCEQFKTVSDVAQSLRRIQQSMDEIMPMMKEINNCLPESDQLEEFSFK